MTLYESWITKAYSKNGQSIKRVWDIYMPLEQKIYEQILENKQPHILGTVLELSEKHNMSVEFICGFLDGIKESLANGSFIDIERLEDTTMVDVYVDFEKLYRKMVEYKAEHLYTLPQWHNIFTPEIRKELYANQKKSGTIVREKDKIGRNDPCPCGSGKKFKKCCGTVNDTIYNEPVQE